MSWFYNFNTHKPSKHHRRPHNCVLFSGLLHEINRIGLTVSCLQPPTAAHSTPWLPQP